mgnify:FL=1
MTKHIHGGDVYKYRNCLDFSANLNPLGTPESVKKAICDSLDHIAEYPQVGSELLREKIAEYEGVKTEEVICGNGAAEVIFTLCRAVNPKKALIPAPTFAEYGQALASTGCELEYYMLTENEGFMLGEAYLDILHKGLDMAFLCNPNNPTGMLIPHRLLKKILEKSRKLGILLVVDECFLDFVKEPQEYSLKRSLSGFDNLFILKAFTKRYAMAGVRLGYGLCSNRVLLDKMERNVQPWNVSTMAQEAGIQARSETEYVEKGRQLVFRESQWLKEEMTRIGYKVFPSEANYIFFKGPEELFDFCLRKRIVIRDCSNYPGLTKGYYRIAVKKHEENVKLIEVLEGGILWQKQ